MGRRSKSIAGVVEGAGLISSIFPALVGAVGARGGTAEDIHRLTRPEGAEIIGLMADIIVGAGGPLYQAGDNSANGRVIGTVDLTVDYGRTVADGFKAGRYNRTNDAITDSHFPHRQVGRVEVRLELVQLFSSVTTDEAELVLVSRGLLQPDMDIQLAVGEQHPDLQRQYSIVFLGAVCVVDGERRVGVLEGDSDDRVGGSDERDCGLAWDDPGGQWHVGHVWAGVRK